MERSAEYSKRAFSLADRVSETERTEITAYYYRPRVSWTRRLMPMDWLPPTTSIMGLV